MEKPLQEWDKRNLDGSISNSLTCSFPNPCVESFINATLEDSENTSKLSTLESVTFSVDSLAVPNPSGITKKTNKSNISAEESQSKPSFEDHSDMEDKRLICQKCKKEISDHVFIFKRRHLYKCCACNYRNANMLNLEMHDYYNACQSSYCYACNYCNELKWDEKELCNKRTCAICKMTYYCMTQLGNHALGHEKVFKYYCRVCGNKISEHVTPHEKEFYKCCQCDYSGVKHLKKHLYIHQDLQM